jgi:hypothetical protein
MSWRVLLGYWRDHHRDERPPSRKDLDPPLEIPRLLPNLMLLEPTDAGYRLRLVGSELARRAGSDNTGRVLKPDVMPDRGLPTFLGFLDTVMATSQPLLYGAYRDRQDWDAIGLVLPLPGRNGEAGMILGGLFHDPNLIRDPGSVWQPGALVALSLEDELARQP